MGQRGVNSSTRGKWVNEGYMSTRGQQVNRSMRGIGQ